MKLQSFSLKVAAVLSLLNQIYCQIGQNCQDISPDPNYTCEDLKARGACTVQSVEFERLKDSAGNVVYCLNTCGLCEYYGSDNQEDSCPYGLSTPNLSVQFESILMVQSYRVSSSSIGFAVGGAKGIDNFHRNIEEGFLPSPFDLTYEGIYNDYYFDTSDNSSDLCDQLFCSYYSAGISPDPLYTSNSSDNEFYLAVGLDSGLQQAEFDRKTLNLVVLLDISGSMDAAFDQYAYDGSQGYWGGQEDRKIEVAKRAIQDMLAHLRNGDRLSLVTFDYSGHVLQDLQKMEDIDMRQLNRTIRCIVTGGGTNLESGYQVATEQLTNCKECMDKDLEQYENRIILLTDAQPNTGVITDYGLFQMVETNSDLSIFTTIIGVGLDFNAELVEALTKTHGANYYTVCSPEEFQKKLDEEFEFMVTPLVFDLKLEIDPSSFDGGNGWQVIKVYGSPNVDGGLSKNGTLIEVSTLFPTPTSEEGIKGGVVLLKLQKPDKDVPLGLKVSYLDRDTMTQHESFQEVTSFENVSGEFYGSTGVRKAIVLARYIDLLRGWLIDQNNIQNNEKIFIPKEYCAYYPDDRIVFEAASSEVCEVPMWSMPNEHILPVFEQIIVDNRNKWERTSNPLIVNKAQGQAFEQFLDYLEGNIQILGDTNMYKEVDLLFKLISISNSD